MDIVVFELFDFQLTVLDICAEQKQKKAGIDGHDGVFLIHLKNVLFKCSNWTTCTTRLLVYCFSLEYASERSNSPGPLSEEDFDVSDVSDDEEDSDDVDETDEDPINENTMEIDGILCVYLWCHKTNAF